MRKPKVRELVEAIKAVVKGPYTSSFPFEPHVPPETSRGKTEFQEDKCVGCGACAEVCPATAITVTDDLDADPPVRRITVRYDNCIFCGQCVLNCTTQEGVIHTTEFDLATLDRETSMASVEKELVLCEMCRAIVGTRDHLLWVARKLGAKSHANPTLMVMEQQDMNLVSHQAARREAPAHRSDIMRVLCPKCRREVLVKESFG
jgi:hydrogenase-4 component H